MKFFKLVRSFVWSPSRYCKNCKEYVDPSYGKCPICGGELEFD